jgi:NADH dehydrogenase FAD-containing subunit
MSTSKHQIVIIGAGNAGISVASKLLLKNKKLVVKQCSKELMVLFHNAVCGTI